VGRILKLAFPLPPGCESEPGVSPALPGRLSEAQAMILEALLENDELWLPKDGNASLARKMVGLPNNREEAAGYLNIARP